MNIAFFEIYPWEKKILKKRLSPHTLHFFEEPLSAKNIDKIKDVEIISVFIYSKVSKKLIEQMPNLKSITTRSTGFDHIDTVFAKKKGISISNVPFYGENTVAEHTFALMLSLSRNIHKSYLRTSRNKFTIEGLKGFDLKGKTLGVIGTGHIGQHVIKIAKGFGMKVIAFDVMKNSFLAEMLDFEYVDFDDVLKNSHIITLHLPHNTHTHHILNKDNLPLLLDGAILINTSRGGLIETEALIDALENGKIAGAGLDVLEGEQLIMEEKEILHKKDPFKDLNALAKDHILLSYENVVFTPHIAFYSEEALLRILETSIENIIHFIDKKPIHSVV